MSESKHTPGPWMVIAETSEHYVISSKEQGNVFECFTFNYNRENALDFQKNTQRINTVLRAI